MKSKKKKQTKDGIKCPYCLHDDLKFNFGFNNHTCRNCRRIVGNQPLPKILEKAIKEKEEKNDNG